MGGEEAGSYVLGYPRKAVYLRLSSNGFQINSDSMVKKIARYDVAVIPASPATETYAARLAQIRQENPHIILLAYFPADFMWNGSAYPVGNIYGDCWRMFQTNDWWLYGTNGQPFSLFGPTFDLSRSVVRNGFANFLQTRVLGTGLWDGLFLDDFCESNYWKEPYANQEIDQNRDHVRDDPAYFDPIWKAGTDSLAAKLRQLAGPTMIISGNCSYGSKWSTMNGWMREDFPFQGSWTSNMFSVSGGYMINEQNYLAPHYNFVYSTSAAPPNQFTPSNVKFMRYCLGSTMMGDGYFMFDDRNEQEIVANWWYDEYEGGGRGRGYLGSALGGYYQTVGALQSPNKLNNSGFESGFTSWSPYNIAGATVLDVTAPPQGTVSSHSLIPLPTPYQSQVHQQQTANLSWGTYSITFWAKSVAPRTVWAMAQLANSPNTILVNNPINIGTTWKLYQATFFLSSTSANVNVSINMGQQVGDVWLDDVKVQTGASAMYRRDFERGIVLVNNTSVPITYPLETTYYKLSGTQDPSVNNGQAVTQVTVPNNDALILVRSSMAGVEATSGLHAGIGFAASRSLAQHGTSFELRLPRGAVVDAELFEVSGRRAAHLFHGALEPGNHPFHWNGRTESGAAAASGVYFARARVQVAGKTQLYSARFVLLH